MIERTANAIGDVRSKNNELKNEKEKLSKKVDELEKDNVQKQNVINALKKHILNSKSASKGAQKETSRSKQFNDSEKVIRNGEEIKKYKIKYKEMKNKYETVLKHYENVREFSSIIFDDNKQLKEKLKKLEEVK